MTTRSTREELSAMLQEPTPNDALARLRQTVHQQREQLGERLLLQEQQCRETAELWAVRARASSGSSSLSGAYEAAAYTRLADKLHSIRCDLLGVPDKDDHDDARTPFDA